MMPRLKLTSQRSSFELQMVRSHKVQDAQAIRSMPKATRSFIVRGGFVGKSLRHSQSVTTKVSYRKMSFRNPSRFRQSLRLTASYITRRGLLDATDEKGNHLTLAEVGDKTHEWDDDHRYYRFIISAENGVKLDLDQYAGAVMAKVREDLLTKDELARDAEIEFVMAHHYDTDHPHTHIMMRAKVEDRHLRLSPGYAAHGLRSRAEEVATGMLGYRIEREQDRDLTDEQKKERAAALIAENRPLLMARRAERGLDPETGKHPDEKTAADGGKAVSKSKEASRDRRGFDGGIE